MSQSDSDPPDPLGLTGKVAVVTGSSQGWGLGIARQLVQRGVAVVVTGSDAERVARAEQAIRSITANARVASAVADIASREGCEQVFAAALDAFGTVDIMINNAGATEQGTILELTPESWRRIVAVELDAQFHFTQLAARHLVAVGKGGRIINMAGGSGFSGLYAFSSHAAAKAGGMGAVLSWARELRKYGIMVNAVAGKIETAQSAAFIARARRDLAEAGLPDRSPRELGFYPPDEAAALVVWLASAKAEGISGRMIHASGPELQVWRMATIEASLYHFENWTPEIIGETGLASILQSGMGVEPRRSREAPKLKS